MLHTFKSQPMGGIMKIEVIESIGKRAYNTLFGNVLEALRYCGLNGKVVMVNNMNAILKYGIKSTPALVINGMVVFAGKSLPTEEIVKLLQQSTTPFT